MARTRTDRNRRLLLAAPFGALLSALASCATYEGSTSLHNNGAQVEGGIAGDSSTGTGGLTAGGSGTVAGASSSVSGTGGGVSAGGASAGTTGSGSAGASGSLSNGGSTSVGGGAGSAGTGGNVGSAGASGSGGTTANGGAGGSAGSGGGPVVDQLLSLGKPATADSEETTKGNLVALGNDGSLTTRWCAADGAAGHYWTVDLGAVDTITKLEVTWEKTAIYKFKVEGSKDNSVWVTVLDQTSSTTASADQTFQLATASGARWIKITVTGLANTTTWASFFEFAVYGH